MTGSMRAYIIEYRHFDKLTNNWNSKISQEGYSSLEAAQTFIERKPSGPVRVTPMYYQTQLLEEYYIHDIHIIEQTEAVSPPPLRPYERTRAAVMATGNKWAIENFNATHG